MADRSKLHRAIMFATEKHAGQKRKGTDYDYICHPLEVAQILTEMYSSDDLIIAGILHDVVEDTELTSDDIERWFGSEVKRLVEAHTHPKKGEWIDRKMAAVESAKNAPLDVKKLVLADTVSNLRSMLADFREIGHEMYDRFNAPEDMQRKYYNAMLDALEFLQYYEETQDAYWEATELFKDLYVSYALKDECIWQSCGDECYFPGGSVRDDAPENESEDRGFVLKGADRIAKKFAEGGQIFVRTSSREDRIRLIEFLETRGYYCVENESYNRQDTIESRFPLLIELDAGCILHLGNVTCSAAAAGSGLLINEREFYLLYALYSTIGKALAGVDHRGD